MHLRPEMVLGVVAVIEEQPVIDLSVAADAPRYRLVGISTVVAKITVQITETVSEVIKRQEIKNHVTPV